jgi:UDP-glucose 4-epimerase
MAVLVCGGAGYIGSHAVSCLLDKGEEVIVVDDLSKGHRESIPSKIKFYHIDLKDKAASKIPFKENKKIDAVMHFCAYSLVGKSVTEPAEYFDNNVGATANLLLSMKEFGVRNFIFSSTAAVYGEPKRLPILETDDTIPTNPYGESKLAVEKMLKWMDACDDIKYAALRYFNASGARPDGGIGEDHTPESHLIPIVLQTALGQRDKITIFGTDYDTKDGTCIRDYIHVMDLIDAHILALDRLRIGGTSDTFNLGSGTGFSVNEIVDYARKITGKQINVEIGTRRAGDPALLIAAADKARNELGWIPKHDAIEKIIEDAWRWHSSHPNGYKK